ncbi:hypothetical protein SEPCBS57363_003838 [Sporothrix epigloea]|uniref:Zn(2)-C6 fungal-type domain-containing protein n=1 Tax=Sporothrix epigloea TaxID=1892477 RepID=A0ABP0DNR0_9PEZI
MYDMLGKSPMRRQNHSCDQCRRSKRACDAPSVAGERDLYVRSDNGVATLSAVPIGTPVTRVNVQIKYPPCSYCFKTNKTCTLEWARSQMQAAEATYANRAIVYRQRRRRAPVQYVQVEHPPDGSDPSSAAHFFMAVYPSPPHPSPSALQTASDYSAGSIGPDGSLDPHGDVPIPWPCQPSSSHDPSHDLAMFAPQPTTIHQQQQTLHNLSDSVDNLDGVNFNPSSGTVGLASTLGCDPIATLDTSTDLIVPTFDGMPFTGSELVSQPVFHYMAPDSTAPWGVGVLPLHTSGLELVNHHDSLNVPPSDSFRSANSEEDDGNSTSATTADNYALQHSASFNHPPYAGAAAQHCVPPYSAMVSPSSHNALEFQIATRINNDTISEGLLQIYHDVLEHNLTCWITEETCPYNVWARPPKQKVVRLLGNNGDAQTVAVGGRRTWSPHSDYQQQFGPTWSNRVYRRVMELDKKAQGAKIMRLTVDQNRRSQKTLHLAIMAFATQWAQGSQRQRETYAAGFATMNGATTNEFDRNIQRSLWQQARQALQDCADIECYRVVCAELIFSITQRPWEESEFAELELTTSSTACGDDLLPSESDVNTQRAQARRRRDAILGKLDEVISKDGPPIFVERAARKMHALKSKFDDYQLGFLGETAQGKRKRHSGQGAHDFTDLMSPHLASEESQTVGLLFWLAVMFDTISASMTGRPVVLADDESQHEAAEHDAVFSDRVYASTTGLDGNTESISLADIAQTMHSHSNSHSGSNGVNPTNFSTNFPSGKKNNRWRIDLFIQDDPSRQSTTQSYHFPCPYDDAARVVTRCAPVKVLLYRQVLYLQSMLRKPYVHKGTPIEEVIQETLMVHRYWNLTYGDFFCELIQHYSVVPTRIRGWFVCLLAHWHLGALLMADLVDAIDENRIGDDASRVLRINAGTVESIRRSSALQLADLARVATPLMANADSDPSMPDFHYAVREGTILTEPWTILLIRAFSKASVIHLHAADDIRDQHLADLLVVEDEASRKSLQLCEECIQALWYLGKKSDMARNVAVVLSRAMNV